MSDNDSQLNSGRFDQKPARWESELREVAVPRDLHARLKAIADGENVGDTEVSSVASATRRPTVARREMGVLLVTLAGILLLAFSMQFLTPEVAVQEMKKSEIADRGPGDSGEVPLPVSEAASLDALLVEKEQLAEQRKRLLKTQLGVQQYQVRRILAATKPRSSRIVDEALELGRGLGLTDDDLADLNRSLAFDVSSGR